MELFNFYIVSKNAFIQDKISNALSSNNLEICEKLMDFKDKSIVFIDSELFHAFANDIYSYISTKVKKKRWFYTLIDDTSNFSGGSIYLNSIKTSEISLKVISNIVENRKIIFQTKNGYELKRMDKLARIFHLYHLLYEEQGIDIKEIAKELGVTDRTIRRDFKVIETVIGTDKIKLDENLKKYYLTK